MHVYRQVPADSGVFLMFSQFPGAALSYHVELNYVMHDAYGQNGFTPESGLGFIYDTGTVDESGCTIPDTDPSCRSDLTKVQ